MPRSPGEIGLFSRGQSFGPRYNIISMLGVGGMGEVYRAWDSELNLAVALKVIRPEATADPLAAARLQKQFKNELVLARQVTHKNVVRIHDLGEIDQIKYITMPYVEGHDLATVLRKAGALGVPRALRVARQIAAGLEAAHEAKVVHRDLKPANIMIAADDHALIMDFGIARSTSGPASKTASIVGTLAYMAPEQAKGLDVDQRADIYAFGLILYEMLTGRRQPSSANSAIVDMQTRIEAGLPPLGSINAEIPAAVAGLVAKCLEIDPANRFQTSTELVAALNRLDDNGEPIPEWRRLTPRLMAAAAALVVVMAGATYFVGRVSVPPAPVQHDPTPVLVTDFDNRSGDPAFDGAIEQGLTLALEGAPYISVFRTRDARRIAAQLTPDKGDRLTREVGQLIARREDLKVLLSGAIDKTRNGFRLTLQAIDPAADPTKTKPIASFSRDITDKAQVLSTVAAMATSVREGLGDKAEELTRIQTPETFTAGSLDAMRAYAKGQNFMDLGRYPEAIAAYEQALAFDPQMGRAYAGLGVAYRNVKQVEKSDASYEQALKLVERMTEREKFRTLGGYYFSVSHNYEKAIENYETLVKLYPADSVGLQNLAFSYVMTGNVQKAVDVGKQAMELYPRSLPARYNYAMYAMYAGGFEIAKAQASLLIKQDPSMYLWLLPLADSTVASGDIVAGREEYARMAAMNDAGRSLASIAEADIAMQAGRYGDALPFLRDGIALDEKGKDDGSAALKYVALAESHLGLGQKLQAAIAAEKAASLSKEEGVLFPAAMALLRAGREDKARAIQSTLDSMLQTKSRSYAKLLEGTIALEHKQIGPAIDALNDGQKRYNSWFSRYLLGMAYMAAGPEHAAEALNEFDLCVKRRGETTDVFIMDTPTLRYLPPAYYWLGRAQESTGQGAAAKTSYEQFIKLRGQAAPSDPLITDATARLAGS